MISLYTHGHKVASYNLDRAKSKLALLDELIGLDRPNILTTWSSDALGRALIDHLFYLVLHKIQAGRHQGFVELPDLLGDLSKFKMIETNQHASIGCLSKESCTYIKDATFDSPILLYPFDGNSLIQLPDYMSHVLTLVRTSDLEHIITDTVGLVVELDKKADAEHLESYTVTALQGTVFLDLPDSCVRIAETIVHEGAHNWLNAMLGYNQLELPEEPQWFSPWRGVPRPVAGIIHGIFAFGCVIEFFSAVDRTRLTPWECAYIDAQRRLQSTRILSLKDYLPNVMRYVSSSEITDIILGVFDNVERRST